MLQVIDIFDGAATHIHENGLIKSICEPHPKSTKSGSVKKLNGEVSPKKRKHLSPTDLSKKYGSPKKKKRASEPGDVSDADSDMPLAELQNCVSDDDDDIILAQLNKAAKKLKKSHSQSKGLENQGARKMKSAVKQNGTISSATVTDDDDDDDVALAVIKQKKDVAKQQNKTVKPSSTRVSPKKKVNL